MNQKFDQILQRRNNGSMKWEDAYIQKRFQIEVNHDTEIFPLFIADMDYALDEKIKKRDVKVICPARPRLFSHSRFFL